MNASVTVRFSAATATPCEIEPYRKSHVRRKICLGGGAVFPVGGELPCAHDRNATTGIGDAHLLENEIRGITSNRFGASVVTDFEGFGARAIRQTVSVASDSLFFLANFLMNLIEP